MKTKIKIMMLFLLIASGIMMQPERAGAAHFSISFQVFYNELSPYGNWIYRPDFGYAWVPDVPAGFFPYATNGHWIYTYSGWTWVSDYTWGWAPFHYGRWYFDDYWGAMWIPGYEWAPAWVVWRSSGDYCGWAPMGPGITIEIALGPNYFVPHKHWRFVRYHDFGRPDIYRHYVHYENNVTIINHTTIVNNIYDNRDGSGRHMAGPHRKEVEHRTGREINPVMIRERATPGQKLAANEMEIYRPKVERSASSGKAPAPAYAKNRDSYEKERPAKYTPSTPARKSEPSSPATPSGRLVKTEPAKKDYGHSPQVKADPGRKEYSKPAPVKAEPPKKSTGPVSKSGSGSEKTKSPNR